MALKTVRIGSAEDIHQYDDAAYPAAIDTDGQPIEIGASTAGTQGVRRDELPTIANIATAAANITDHAIVRGDGGAKGIQGSKVEIDDNGVIGFQAGAGLSMAEIYAYNVASTITIVGVGKANKVQITSFNTNGLSKGLLTPDHANDHITVGADGYYLCTVSITIESIAAGAADTIGVSVFKNNGATEYQNIHAHRQLSGGGGDVGSLSLSGLISCSNTDTIEVWLWNETNIRDVVVDDITLSLICIGRG